ncbi:MAG: ACT domain-containing protein, partial [Candidatus Omnitrophota bacterium]
GSKPTSSAVVADLVDIAVRREARLTEDAILMRALGRRLAIKSISSIESRYYLRFQVVDRPGVLAKISSVLGKSRISISDVIQRERSAGKVVPLILLTHDAFEHDLRKAIGRIDRLGIVRDPSQVIRIEGN